nr:hypothetical protein [Tanacetum cinerariifolium]
MKMEQYLDHTDYALGEVILNGNSVVQMTKDEAGNEIEVPLVTAQQILARTRERKEGLDKGYDRFQRLLSLLKIHEAGVSTEDANQKFLRSLPSSWSNIYLIMRNKPGIDNLDIDDMYNNLKVYEANSKGYFGSSSNLQNVAFVSTESTSSTNELNAAYSVFTATSHSSQAQGPLHMLMNSCSHFLLSNLVAMLFMTVKRFYKKTTRKLEFNRKEPVGFEKNKVECFNCHRRGHFARDCRSARNLRNRSRDVGNAGYIERDNGKRPAKEEDEQALKVQDGLGTYDWSYQVEEEATDFALMAFTLNPSSSSSSISELDEALKEKEDLKAKLKKFETSSKNLTNLCDSQISVKVKTGLRYDSQFNKKEVLDIKEKEVTETMFDNRSSDKENSVANDRFKKGERYHAVPPPLTRNYMPPKPDLLFDGLDDSIYNFKISETVSSLTKDEKDAPETSTACVEKPKEDRSSAPLIEDWETDSDDNNVFTPEPIPAKIDFVKLGESVKHVKPVESVKHVKPVTPVKTAEQTKKSRNFSSSPKVDRKDWNGKMTQKLGLGFGFTKKACFMCGSLSHLIKDCTFYEDRMAKKSMLPTNVEKGTGHRESRLAWINV